MLPGAVDVQLAGGEAVDTTLGQREVVDTQPTQEGKGVKPAQQR
jgi:hypothetical protein